MNTRIAALVVLTALTSCTGVKKFYNTEYVLYDSEAEAEAANAASQPSTGAPAMTPEARASRIAELESELRALDRAIRAGLDEEGSLAKRRTAAEQELIALQGASPTQDR